MPYPLALSADADQLKLTEVPNPPPAEVCCPAEAGWLMYILTPHSAKLGSLSYGRLRYPKPHPLSHKN